MLSGALIAAARSGTDEVALGQIYSTDAGDPIDVIAEQGDVSGTICANVGGFRYGSATSCFAADGARVTGSWELVIPTSRRTAPLVMGVLPAAANGATVVVRNERIEATPRGRWFLASLEPGALGPNNAAPVRVEFD